MPRATDILNGLRFSPVEPSNPDGPCVAVTTKKQGAYLLDLLRREQRFGQTPNPVYVGDRGGKDDRHQYEVRRMGRRFAHNGNGDVCHVLRCWDCGADGAL